MIGYSIISTLMFALISLANLYMLSKQASNEPVENKPMTPKGRVTSILVFGFLAFWGLLSIIVCISRIVHG
jgi:hypothetical protein